VQQILVTFTKLQKTTVSFVSACPFVCLHGATGLPLDGFSWNWDNVEKYRWTGCRWQYGACTLHAGYL